MCFNALTSGDRGAQTETGTTEVGVSSRVGKRVLYHSRRFRRHRTRLPPGRGFRVSHANIDDTLPVPRKKTCSRCPSAVILEGTKSSTKLQEWVSIFRSTDLDSLIASPMDVHNPKPSLYREYTF